MCGILSSRGIKLLNNFMLRLAAYETHKNTDLLVYYMSQVDDRYLRGSVPNDSATS